MPILFDTQSRFGRELLVISAFADLKDSAESFEAVLKMELMYSV